MNNERGQALPMAIVALAIGALVVVPFLSHAGTTLLDSRLFAGGINADNAADAGVEHAIWNLAESSLASQIPNVNNTKTYSLPEALNGITPSIKVTTLSVASGGSGTTGTIDKTIIDSLIFDATAGYTPDTVHVVNDIYAVAYTGSSNKGYVETMSITSNGTIGNAPISTLLIENSASYEQDLFPVTGNIYAVAYRANSNRGRLITLSISPAGVTGGAIINTLNFDTSACYTPSVTQITSTVYAIAYRGASNRGTLKTVSISADGTTIAVIRTLVFDTTACYEPKITKVTGNYYAIAYRGPSNRGYLKTFTINSAGTIGGAAVSTLIYDATGPCSEPEILNVSGTYYAIPYRNATNQGKLVTVTISAAGVIGASVISTLIFDSATGYEPAIIKVANDVFAIAYRSSTFKGYLKSVTISATGIITSPVIDTFNFETTTCYNPNLIRIAGNVYGVAYRGIGNDGSFVTIGVSDGTGNPITSYEIISTAGESTIRALVNTQNSSSVITTTIISWFPN